MDKMGMIGKMGRMGQIGPRLNLDRSVNCYFCGKLFDERDGYPADEYNGNDGGEMCPECQKLKIKDEES